MARLLATLLRSDGLRQSSFTVVGNTLSTGISAVALLLISRALGPAAFGQFSVGFAIIIMLNKFNDAGLNAAILKFAGGSQDTQLRQGVFSFTGRIKLYLSLAIITVGMLISPWLANLLHYESPTIVYLAFLLSVISSWYEHLITVLQALHRFSQAVAINAIQAVTKLLSVGTLLLLLGLGTPLPIFILYMTCPASPLLFLRKLLPSTISLFKLDHHLSVETQKQITAMARHSALGFIAAGIIENIDVLFVQRYLSEYETGLLGGVSRISMMITLIAYSLGNVLYPRVARYTTKTHLSAYLKKAAMIAALAGFGFFLFLPLARYSILFTIGPAYLDGAVALYILAASAFITIAAIPFLAVFYALKANWYFSVSGIIQLLIILVGNGLFVPEYGLLASAWTRLVVRIFLLVFTVATALIMYRKTFRV